MPRLREAPMQEQMPGTLPEAPDVSAVSARRLAERTAPGISRTAGISHTCRTACRVRAFSLSAWLPCGVRVRFPTPLRGALHCGPPSVVACGGPAPRGPCRGSQKGGRTHGPEVRGGWGPSNLAAFGLTDLGFGRSFGATGATDASEPESGTNSPNPISVGLLPVRLSCTLPGFALIPPCPIKLA